MVKTRKKTGKSAVPPNAFAGKSERPNDDELAATLGPAKSHWDQLVNDLTRENHLDVHEWNSSSAKAGWSLRLKRGERIIVYLIPLRGGFQAALVLGDKALKATQQSQLPARARKIIAEAPRYAEGTGVRITVNGREDLSAIKKLARIKSEG
jgi:Protein of unknown function (DUF3788)